MPEECHIYSSWHVGFVPCTKESPQKHHYFLSLACGSTQIQFALTHAILVHPPVICPTAFSRSSYSPSNTEKGKFDFQSMSTESPVEQKSPREDCVLRDRCQPFPQISMTGRQQQVKTKRHTLEFIVSSRSSQSSRGGVSATKFITATRFHHNTLVY